MVHVAYVNGRQGGGGLLPPKVPRPAERPCEMMRAGPLKPLAGGCDRAYS